MDKFTNHTHTAVRERVDIVSRLLSVIQANDFGDNRYEIIHLQGTMSTVIRGIEAKALVNLETTNTRVVITLVVEEGTFDHGTSVFDGSQVTWAETTINFEKGCSLRAGSILVDGGVNVVNCTSVNIFEFCLNINILHNAKSAEKGSDWDFTTAIDLHIDTTIWCGLEFKPCTTTWNHLSTVIALHANGFGSEKDTS